MLKFWEEDIFVHDWFSIYPEETTTIKTEFILDFSNTPFILRPSIILCTPNEF